MIERDHILGGVSLGREVGVNYERRDQMFYGIRRCPKGVYQEFCVEYPGFKVSGSGTNIATGSWKVR